MAVQFSSGALEEVQRILGKYPVKRAAIMPVLWLAQKEFGHLSAEVQQYVADLLGFPLAWVSGLASFYTMYYKKPIGKYHLQVCTNVSCMLRGSDDVLRVIEDRLKVGLGQTTADGKFSLDEVECLASCGTAPMMQVNEDYHENLTPRSTLELIERLARD
jgi:NADH-quinone oxidoreductase E subunit